MTDTATLTAGRELDALVAERVFALDVRRHWPCWWYDADRAYVPCQSPVPPGGVVEQYDCVYGREGDFTVVPRYSTDIAAAWAVVEQLRAHGFDAFSLAIDNDIPGQAWRAMFYGERRNYGHGETAPLAICRAALAVVTGPS